MMQGGCRPLDPRLASGGACGGLWRRSRWRGRGGHAAIVAAAEAMVAEARAVVAVVAVVVAITAVAAVVFSLCERNSTGREGEAERREPGASSALWKRARCKGATVSIDEWQGSKLGWGLMRVRVCGARSVRSQEQPSAVG